MRELSVEEFELLQEKEEVVSVEHSGQDYCQLEGKGKYYVTYTDGTEETVLVKNKSFGSEEEEEYE